MSDDFMMPPVVVDLTTRRPDDRQWSFYGGPLDGETRWLPKVQETLQMIFAMPPIGRRSVWHGHYAPAGDADTLNRVMRWTQYADTEAQP